MAFQNKNAIINENRIPIKNISVWAFTTPALEPVFPLFETTETLPILLVVYVVSMPNDGKPAAAVFNAVATSLLLKPDTEVVGATNESV